MSTIFAIQLLVVVACILTAERRNRLSAGKLLDEMFKNGIAGVDVRRLPDGSINILLVLRNEHSYVLTASNWNGRRARALTERFSSLGFRWLAFAAWKLRSHPEYEGRIWHDGNGRHLSLVKATRR